MLITKFTSESAHLGAKSAIAVSIPGICQADRVQQGSFAHLQGFPERWRETSAVPGCPFAHAG